MPILVEATARTNPHFLIRRLLPSIAALVIDSFGSRGLSNSVFDQTLLTRWEAANDAIAGLKWLYGDGRTPRNRRNFGFKVQETVYTVDRDELDKIAVTYDVREK